MKIFVAGATGVLGKRVVAGLNKLGHEVVGISRSNEDSEIIESEGAEARRGSLSDTYGLAEISCDSDAIINLCAAIPTKSRTRIDDWVLTSRFRTEETANLIAAARRNNCTLFIQESVTFVYGGRHGEWVDETCPPSRNVPTSVKSCVEMEGQIRAAAGRHDLPAIILRFGNIYSSDSEYTALMYRHISEGKYPVIEKGNVYWNLVTADDAAAAVIAAVKNRERNTGKIFNVCDDKPVTYKELLTYIAKLLDAPDPGSIPIFLAKAAMGRRTVDYLLQNVRCVNRRAKEELGWTLTCPTYREGQPREIARWLNHGPEVNPDLAAPV